MCVCACVCRVGESKRINVRETRPLQKRDAHRVVAALWWLQLRLQSHNFGHNKSVESSSPYRKLYTHFLISPSPLCTPEPAPPPTLTKKHIVGNLAHLPTSSVCRGVFLRNFPTPTCRGGALVVLTPVPLLFHVPSAFLSTHSSSLCQITRGVFTQKHHMKLHDLTFPVLFLASCCDERLARKLALNLHKNYTALHIYHTHSSRWDMSFLYSNIPAYSLQQLTGDPTNSSGIYGIHLKH